jgi:predicted RNase H-like HicB family nuclease
MAQYAKSNTWTSRVSCSAGSLQRGRSDDTPARNALVPMPSLVLGFRSSGTGYSGGASPVPTPRVAAPKQAVEPTPPPAAPSDPPAQAAETQDRPAVVKQGDSIDLIIDKLPRHRLIKPVPVSISPLGDRVFVASAPDLDITVTGNSLSDALLLLKQHLETSYDGLRKAGSASNKEQEKQLQRLRAYIQDS